MKTIRLKTWPEYYQMMEDGTKTFELREDDRNAKVGDLLTLLEWDNNLEEYTGREMTVGIGAVLRDVPQFGLMSGYCIIQTVNLDHNHDMEDERDTARAELVRLEAENERLRGNISAARSELESLSPSDFNFSMAHHTMVFGLSFLQQQTPALEPQETTE